MKKILSLLFVFIFVLLLPVACKSPGGDEKNPEDKNQSGQTKPTEKEQDKDQTPVIGGKYVVKNGASEYEIIIPDGASGITQLAATEFNYFFSRATEISLKIKTESEYSASGKYISIGDTSLAETVSVPEGQLGRQGFRIVTVGDNVVVNAAGEYGLLWGAYELLGRMFGYEYYAKDVYYIDRDVKELPLKDYAIIDRPDIETRCAADSQNKNDSEVAHRMRQINIWDEFFMSMQNPCHNSFYYVGDENGNVESKYLATSGAQLCYTGHGDDAVVEEMLNKSLEYLKTIIMKSDRSDVMYGMEDQPGNWCQCAACKESKARYGTDSAAVILYMNRFRDKLDAWLAEAGIDREINVYFFAYNDITKPPVHKKEGGTYEANDPSIVCKDGVGIMFAPITNNFTQSITSEINDSTYQQFLGMSAVTKKLLVWSYSCNFTDYFAPYDATSHMAELFRTIVDCSGTFLFNQGRHNQGDSSQFDTLRQYLVSKLAWDVDADVEKLTDNFFDTYFGKAKEPMKKMYDELMTLERYNYEVLGMSGGVYGDVIKEKFWPVQTLNNWLGYIDEAYTLAGDDDVLRRRILKESIFVRFIQLRLYILDGDDIEEVRQQFIKDAQSVGIARYSEGGTITNVFN